MRALSALLAAAAAVLVLAPAGVPAPPQRMQVVQDEWFLNLSRQRLKPGRVTIEVVNFGQDAHDLVIQRKGAKAIRVPKQDHFMRKEITVKLTAGTYTLWCSLPQHRARGMVAPLTVR